MIFSICYGRAMLISTVVALTVIWYLVHSLPGVLESVGYLFGLLLASFTVDALIQRRND